jgi:hypothetical protein
MTKEGTYERVTVELDPQTPEPVVASEEKTVKRTRKVEASPASFEPTETPDF